MRSQDVCVCVSGEKEDSGPLGGIGGEEGDAHWDEVLILDCIRSRVSGNILSPVYLPR